MRGRKLKAEMAVVPEELWRRIVEIGTDSAFSGGGGGSILSYKDLCCLSMSCRRFRRISDDNSFWSRLLSQDFQTSSHSSHTIKYQYKIRYERDKERKMLAHRRAVLRIESAISEHHRRIHDLNLKCIAESERVRKTQAELMNLHAVRQASVALNVWQPEVIRGRQEHLVGQCNVAVDSRIASLEMELRLCKQQITGFEKAIKVERRRLGSAKEQLDSLQYHPLQGIGSKKRRKKAITSHQGLVKLNDLPFPSVRH